MTSVIRQFVFLDIDEAQPKGCAFSLRLMTKANEMCGPTAIHEHFGDQHAGKGGQIILEGGFRLLLLDYIR